jgi:hypothetical protein
LGVVKLFGRNELSEDRTSKRQKTYFYGPITGGFAGDEPLIAERGGRNGKKRAMIATARKLAVLLHHLSISEKYTNPCTTAAA